MEIKLDQLAAMESWIIDGWGPWQSIEHRLRAADTIIFIDLPLWMHFWLAAERQIGVARGFGRADPIEGCDQLDATERIFEMIWRVHTDLLPGLHQLLDRCKVGKNYHHITSIEVLDAF